MKLLIFLLIPTLLLGQGNRPTSRLEDPNTTGMNRGQRKAARNIFKVNNGRAAEKAHKDRLKDDIAEDKARGMQPAGRRGGMRVRLHWSTQADFDTWKAKYDGMPGLRKGNKNRYALIIGFPAYEFPGDDVTPPSGRPYTEVYLVESEIHWMEHNGVTVTKPGSFTTTWIPPPDP